MTSRPARLAWGTPPSTAIAIATLPRHPERLAIFAYEAGDEMAGLRAPARRVSLFLSYDAASALTADGWALFDAAIRWAAMPALKPP